MLTNNLSLAALLPHSSAPCCQFMANPRVLTGLVRIKPLLTLLIAESPRHVGGQRHREIVSNRSAWTSCRASKAVGTSRHGKLLSKPVVECVDSAILRARGTCYSQQIDQLSKDLVRVVGLEPTLLAETDFESVASTIPPHPQRTCPPW